MRFLRVIPLSVWALLAGELVLVISVYLLATAVMSPVDAWVWLTVGDGLLRVTLMAFGVLFGLYMLDLYTHIQVSSISTMFQQTCLVVGVAFLFQASLSYLAPPLILPRWIMMAGSLALLVVLPAWRWLYSRTILASNADERVLLVGTNDLVVDIARELQFRPEMGLEVVGYVEDVPEPRLAGLSHLGNLPEMCEIAARLKPDRIVVGLRDMGEKMPANKLLHLGYEGFRIEDAETTFEALHGRVSLGHVRPHQLIFTRNVGPQPLLINLQSIYSFVLAALGVIIFSPVMVVVAILVKVTSPGPVFYRQVRVGLRGRHFSILKFRSMRQDAERTSGAVWAAKDDPRVTRLGKWLRKLRLDELPQLFNVLRGDMAIVGPRPERPEFVEELSLSVPFYRQRLTVRPGITGWAQINYRYGDTAADAITKLEYDLYYIKYLTPALDFYIMFHTVKIMLLARGAQ
jgi:exopolysaccharide biosynthesis polyprenyl glycosylphosphotransferase